MKCVWTGKPKHGNQKGFALILSIFFMVALMVMVAGGFLSLTRTQHEHVRGQERLETAWAARGVIEMMIKKMDEFRQVHDCLPHDGAAHGGGLPEDPSCFIVTTDKDVDLILADVATASSANPLFSGPDAKFSMDLNIAVAEVGPQNSYRDYTLTAKVKDLKSNWVTERKQKIKMISGKVFDYAVFYENDMELSPGAGAKVQGPLLTNGNMHLMSGKNKLLELTSPGTGSRNDYILKAKGNIYAFFKPVLGRNYMNDINAYYKSTSPLRYSNRGGGSSTENSNNLETMNSTPGTVATAPLVYYLRNDIFALSDPDYYPLPETGARILPSRITIGGVPMVYPRIDLAGYENNWDFFSNLSYYTSKQYVYTRMNPSGYAASHNMSVSSALDRAIFMRALQPPVPTDPQRFQQANSAVDYKLDMQELTPAVNPAWTNLIGSGGTLEGKVFEGVARQEIPIGTAGTNKHVLIEPLVACTDDDPDPTIRAANQAAKIENVRRHLGAEIPFTLENCEAVQKLQFIKKADILIACSDDSCENAAVSLKGFPNRIPIAIPGFLSQTQLRDDRLKGIFPAWQIDVEDLKSYWDQPPNFGKPLTVYVQTKSFKSGGVETGCEITGTCLSTRSVKLFNAAHYLPEGGLTVVTNGRLWVQGNFNTNSDACTGANPSGDGDTEYPGCVKDQPSAALIADSIGVLSNTFSLADETNTNFSQHPRVGQPRVGVGRPQDDPYANLTLNAAIMAGYLESQLERRYPDCDGKDGGGAFSYEGCRDPWFMHTWRIRPSPENRPNNVTCADDTNIACNAIFDNGIFYFKRNLLLKNIWDTMWAAWDENKKYLDSLPAWVPPPGRAAAGFPLKETPPLDIASKNSINALFAGMTGDLDTSLHNTLKSSFALGVYAISLPAIRIVSETNINDNYILLYAISSPGGLANCGAGNVVIPQTFDDTPCTPAKNIRGYNQFIKYPLSDALANWSALTSSAGMAISVQEPNTAGAMDSTTSLVTRRYIVYWRQLKFDFNTIPNWKIPTHSSGYGVKADGSVCYGLSQTCMPEAVTLWPGLSADVLGVGNGYAFAANVWGYNQTSATCGTQGESGGGGCAPVNYTGFGYFNFLDTNRNADLVPQRDPYRIISYYNGRQAPLYYIRYSGGVENLINLQERWDYDDVIPADALDSDGDINNIHRTLYFSGTLAAPWFAEELWVRDGSGGKKPAFLVTPDDNRPYYTAPRRVIDYNEQLSQDPPPSTPSLYETKRLSYSEKAV